jgi:DNA-binding MarR family transcriptional regulator
MKQTGLSKKTVQRVIDKLIDKDFITIETPADIYRRTATVYRVRRQEAILASHEGKQRRHVAKVGPGKVYVRPFANTRPL